jgi:hypothetical protein
MRLDTLLPGYGCMMAPSLVPAAKYTSDDLLATLRVLGPWWFCLTEHLADPLGDPVLAQLLAEQQRVLHDLAMEAPLPTELLTLDLSGERELSLAASLLRQRDARALRPSLERCIDRSMQLILEGSARVRALRRSPRIANGRVEGLFVSDGGVPKVAVPSVDVGPRGLSGDRQRTRRHHGRAWQALCLWSAEVVGGLQLEGHPIALGSAGENISIRGLNWADVLPGSQLRIGNMLCEVSLYALPCSKNSAWFVGGDFERMHHRREAGVSRVYASVLEPGRIDSGDAVALR